MQNRLQEKGIYSSEIRTFHSFGYKIVRESFNWKFQDNGNRRTKRNLLRNAVSKKYPIPARRNRDPIDVFQDALRQAKMELIPLEEIKVEYENKIYPFQEVFLNYIESQKQISFMDFDDMIYLAIRALLDDDLLREQYQDKFEYILVDEYQDLNQAQLILLHLISLPENNIFVVGDDDQMIYGWRGAEIRHILDFNKRYSITKNIVLSTNYRSSKKIIRHAKWLINHNQERVAKEIRPRKGAKSGNFELTVHNTLWEQAKAAADWILVNHSKHELRWNDFAILFRYNAFQFPLAMALDQVKIPHSPVMGEHLFQTKVGEDVFAYLSIILHPSEAMKD
jgi:DNA helicase-2/ATP-dependent DNA helicase PcrA